MVSWPSFSVSVILPSRFSIRFIASRPQTRYRHHRCAGGRKAGQNRRTGGFMSEAEQHSRSGTLAGVTAEADPGTLALLPDEALLEIIQRQTFRFFWEGAHPVSGLAFDRRTTNDAPTGDKVAVGGSGFGIMAIVVAVERGWISRDAALERLGRML